MRCKVGRGWSENDPRRVRASGLDNVRAGHWPELEEESLYGILIAEPGRLPMQMAPTVEFHITPQERLANPGSRRVE